MEPVLDMADNKHRMIAVTCIVNMYSIMKKLLTFAPRQHERILLGIPILRPYNVTIVVSGGVAVKTIPDCEAFFSHFGTSLSEVKVRYWYSP